MPHTQTHAALNTTQCPSHPGLAMEFSGSSRLTLSMYRAQVRIFSEKLNSRILRPGGGRGKADHFSDVCLNIYSAGLGLPAPSARVVFISFTLVWHVSRLFAKWKLPVCQLFGDAEHLLGSKGESWTCRSSEAWLIEWYASLTPCHNGLPLMHNFQILPKKKTTAGRRDGSTTEEYKVPVCTYKGWRQLKAGHCVKATWRNKPTRIQNAEEPDCSHAG